MIFQCDKLHAHIKITVVSKKMVKYYIFTCLYSDKGVNLSNQWKSMTIGQLIVQLFWCFNTQQCTITTSVINHEDLSVNNHWRFIDVLINNLFSLNVALVQ